MKKIEQTLIKQAVEVLKQNEPQTLIKQAVEVLKQNEPQSGYYGCFSGGKDSVALKHLAGLAGVKVRWHYNQTTIDPPEVVRFIREQHRDVKWLKPRYGNFFRRMEAKCYVPTRRVPWCCDEYKERRIPKGEVMLMGIRAEESAARSKNWSVVGTHHRKNTPVVLPIIDWDSELLWGFLREEKVPVPFLYAEGFKRLGCVGCPKTGRTERQREFERWPRFEHRWKLSFRRIWAMKEGTKQKNGCEWFGSALFGDWEEMWQWWRLGRSLPSREQMVMFK